MKKLFAAWCIVIAATLRGYSQSSVQLLLAQSDLETGTWDNDGKWWTDKNLFGMSEMQNADRRKRLVGVRMGPDGLKRAQFASLWSSVQDRLDWDTQMQISQKDYLYSVSSKFHPSPDYPGSVLNRIKGTQQMYFSALALTPIIILIIWKIIKLILAVR